MRKYYICPEGCKWTETEAATAEAPAVKSPLPIRRALSVRLLPQRQQISRSTARSSCKSRKREVLTAF